MVCLPKLLQGVLSSSYRYSFRLELDDSSQLTLFPCVLCQISMSILYGKYISNLGKSVSGGRGKLLVFMWND